MHKYDMNIKILIILEFVSINLRWKRVPVVFSKIMFFGCSMSTRYTTCDKRAAEVRVENQSSCRRLNRASARADTQMTHRKESNTESGHNTKWLITANGPLQS